MNLVVLQASFSPVSIEYGLLIELNMVTHKTELKLRTPEFFGVNGWLIFSSPSQH